MAYFQNCDWNKLGEWLRWSSNPYGDWNKWSRICRRRWIIADLRRLDTSEKVLRFQAFFQDFFTLFSAKASWYMTSGAGYELRIKISLKKHFGFVISLGSGTRTWHFPLYFLPFLLQRFWGWHFSFFLAVGWCLLMPSLMCIYTINF